MSILTITFHFPRLYIPNYPTDADNAWDIHQGVGMHDIQPPTDKLSTAFRSYC